nr:DUF3221 domain-containing protein [Anaerosalibacter massiliensis]
MGCNKKEEQVGIKGKITEIHIVEEEITSVLIEGDIEENAMYDKANVAIKDSTKIYKDDEEINAEDLEEGQIIEVIFDGPVAESHPVQGTAKTINIIE